MNSKLICNIRTCTLLTQLYLLVIYMIVVNELTTKKTWRSSSCSCLLVFSEIRVLFKKMCIKKKLYLTKALAMSVDDSFTTVLEYKVLITSHKFLINSNV